MPATFAAVIDHTAVELDRRIAACDSLLADEKLANTFRESATARKADAEAAKALLVHLTAAGTVEKLLMAMLLRVRSSYVEGTTADTGEGWFTLRDMINESMQVCDNGQTELRGAVAGVVADAVYNERNVLAATDTIMGLLPA